jgi:aldose 1-epimerase
MKRKLSSTVLELREGDSKIKIEVLPEFGAQLKSFSVNGRELLYFSEEKFLSKEQVYSGSFNMFPTLCRLTGARYNFKGREIRQRKNGKDYPIHGLIRDEVLNIVRGTNFIEASIEIDEKHPVYQGYPFPSKLLLKYQILDNGLKISFDYQNKGSQSAPFCFGVHPYWKIEGDRRDIEIKIPCNYAPELKDLVPTGRMVKVDNTEYDLRNWKKLSEVHIDKSFYGRIKNEKGGIFWKKEKLRLNIDASPELTHMIGYVPEDLPAICIENLTASPDAPNLYNKGYKAESGLVVVPPGKHYSGWISWTTEKD